MATEREGDAVLELDGVAFAYGREPVLTGVSGTVRAGGSVALVGPNGAGKSTLLKGILGLVPVVSGTLAVLGTSPRRARGRIGYVPQADTLDPDFPVTAAQVVMMGRYRAIGPLRRPGRRDRELVAAALDRVGMTEVGRYRFGSLSGGQRQRILLARSLAGGPRLLLLDEPWNGLDAVSQQSLVDTLRTLTAEGVAVVVSTHDLSLAHLACAEACLLNGHQYAFGPTACTLTAENLRETYGSQAVRLGSGHVVVAGG